MAVPSITTGNTTGHGAADPRSVESWLVSGWSRPPSRVAAERPAVAGLHLRAGRGPRVLPRRRHAGLGGSVGAVESTIERRAAISGQQHLPPTLLRLSVGIEAVEDLWTDVDRAVRDAPAI
jgi:hypothetical protein